MPHQKKTRRKRTHRAKPPQEKGPQVVRFSPLRVATEALEKATQDVERWEGQLAQRRLDLQEAERTLGDQVVGGVDPGAPVNKETTDAAVTAAGDRIARLRVAVEAAEAAVLKAKQNVDAKQRAVWNAEADEHEVKANRLRARADKRQRETDELLKQLREHEQVEYVPKPPEEPAVRGESFVRFVSIPKTAALLNEATQLEQRADQLRQRAADTPEARAQKEAERRRGREEWLAWEQEQAEGGETVTDYRDLDNITARSRFMKPGPDATPEERTAYEKAVAVRAQLRRKDEERREVGIL